MMKKAAVAKNVAVEFDAKVREYRLLNEQRKSIEKQEKALLAELEARYSKEVWEKEIIKGICTEMEKCPVNKNEYQIEAVRKILPEAIVESVDNATVKQAIKDKKITQDAADACKGDDKWSYKSIFRVLENAVLKVVK